MATIQYKCDTCKREISLVENQQGLTVFAKCVITQGCKGHLYRISRNPDIIREDLDFPPPVQGLDDYTPRRVFFEKTQNISANPWLIEHNLGVSPAVTIYIFSESTGLPVELSADEYTITVIDANNIRVSFNSPKRGIAHLIARSSVPAKVSSVPDASTRFTVSNSGIMTLGVPIIIPNGLGNGIDLFTVQKDIGIEVEIKIPSETTKVVQDDFLIDGPNSVSSWVRWNQVKLRKRRDYSIKSFDVLELFKSAFPDITSLDKIPDGSSFRITEIDFKGVAGYSDIESRQLILFLSASPYGPVDKIRNRLVDVGELLLSDTGEFFVFDGEVTINENNIEKTFPLIEQTDATSPTPTPSVTMSATPTPTPTPTSGLTPTPSVTASLTPSVTPSVSVSLSPTPQASPTATPLPTVTPTNTQTPSVTPSNTPDASATPTPAVTETPFPTITPTPSPPAPTPTPSPSEQGIVAITNKGLSNFELEPAVPDAGIRFNTDGRLEIADGSTSGSYVDVTGEWFTTSPVSGIGNDYQVRLVQTGSSGGTINISGPALNTWHDLSSLVGWVFTRNSTGSGSVDFTMSIRDASTLTIEDSADLSVFLEMSTAF